MHYFFLGFRKVRVIIFRLYILIKLTQRHGVTVYPFLLTFYNLITLELNSNLKMSLDIHRYLSLYFIKVSKAFLKKQKIQHANANNINWKSVFLCHCYITNDHRLSNLKHPIYLLVYISVCQKSRWAWPSSVLGVSQVWNQSVGWAGLLSGSSHKESASELIHVVEAPVSLFPFWLLPGDGFQLLEATHVLCLGPPPSSSRQGCVRSLSCFTALWLLLPARENSTSKAWPDWRGPCE